jgi:hypothetical protein
MKTIYIPSPEVVAKEVQRQREEEERNARIDDILEACVAKIYAEKGAGFICVVLPRHINQFELNAVSDRLGRAGWSCHLPQVTRRTDQLIIKIPPRRHIAPKH